MGCTQSSQREPSPSPTALAPDALPTTQASAFHRRRRTTSSSSTSISNPALNVAPSTSRRPPNAPLAQPLPWRSTSRRWTPATLAHERAAFFDTRVSGSQEAWGAVQLATSMARTDLSALHETSEVREPDHADRDGDVDRNAHGERPPRDGLSGAKAVLDAAGLTVPTGFLVDGVWDERGVLYKLPRWVVSDPLNIEDDVAGADGVEKGAGLTGQAKTDKETAAVLDKGKAVAVAGVGDEDGGKVLVKLRLSDRGTDVVLAASPERTKIRDIVDEVRREAHIPPGTRVALAYMGKMLKDGQPLARQDWKVGDVVNCLVFR